MKLVSKRMIVLHSLAWTSFVFAQPVFQYLQSDPAFITSHRIGWPMVLLVVLLLSLLLPLMLSLLLLIMHFFSVKLTLSLFQFFTLLWASLLTLQGLCIFPEISAVTACFGALLGGFVVLAAMIRMPIVRDFVSIMAAGSLIFPLVFLYQPQVQKALAGAHKPPLVLANDRTLRKIPITLVIFDELPLVGLLDSSHHIDAVRYPNFARLAKYSTWYRNASTVHGRTDSAVPAILTGMYPPAAPSHSWSTDYPRNLFTFLRWHFELNVFEQFTQLCSDYQCSRDRSWRSLTPYLLNIAKDLFVSWTRYTLPDKIFYAMQSPQSLIFRIFASAPRRQLHLSSNQDSAANPLWNDDVYLFSKFVESLRAEPNAHLNFLHVTFPHTPYIYFPDGQRYAGQNLRFAGSGHEEVRAQEKWLAVVDYQRFLLQLQFTDSLLGLLLNRLEELDIFHSGLLIVTADHGVSFTPGEHTRTPFGDTQSEVLLVPLLVKLPGQTDGNIDDRNAESIDIVPTILDVIDMPEPWPFDGSSLLTKEHIRNSKSFHTVAQSGPVLLSFPKQIDIGAALERKLKYFGEGGASIYSIGPRTAKIKGASLAEAGAQVRLRPDLNGAHDLDAVNLSAPSIPAFLRGEFLLPDGYHAPLHIAIAVNGKVAATAIAYASSMSHASFSALLPQQALRSGKNEIEVGILGPAPEDFS